MSKKEGIISLKSLEEINENVELKDGLKFRVELMGKVDSDLIKFIVENGVSSSGNSYIVNPKFVNANINSRLVQNNGNILGFIVSFPHNLIFDNEIIKTSISTNLCVSVDHRDIHLAQYLISSIINFGFKNGIHTGYHFIPEPRTNVSMKVEAFFRPLTLRLAETYGYQFPTKDFELSQNSEYVVRPSIYEDLGLIKELNRKINIHLNEGDFARLLLDAQALTVIRKNKPVGIFIYKPVLLSIGSIGKVCPLARLIYFESSERHSFNCMAKLLHYLTDMEKFAVLSGVGIGPMANRKFRNLLGCSTSGELYLDFYNFYLMEESKKIETINLMYM